MPAVVQYTYIQQIPSKRADFPRANYIATNHRQCLLNLSLLLLLLLFSPFLCRTQPTISQFNSLEIRRSRNFM